MRAPARRGFTLIEVLVALGLAAALLGSVIVFVSNLREARGRLEERTMRERAVDHFFDALEASILTSMLDAGDGGFEGSEESCTIFTASVDAAATLERGGRPFIPASRSWFGVDRSRGALLVRRGDSAPEALPAGIDALQFRYHDGREWVSAFDARTQGRLPTAIEVSVWLAAAAPAGEVARPAEERDGEGGGADSRGGAATRGSADERARSAGLFEPPEAPEAPPDRRRVIVIPDSAPAELLPATVERTP